MNRVTEVEERYRTLRPEYDQYVTKLKGLLGDLASDAGIDLSQVEGRTKSLESFIDKIRRKSYDDPLREISDLADLRIITYYHDDVPRVVELVRREFDVLPEESADKLEQLDVGEFGYRSWHLIVRLSGPRSTLPEWKRFAPLLAEVQIRSVLQHAWAAISHKLDYKKTAQAPRELRRQLFRLSALLELADEEFASIRDDSQAIVARYNQELRAGDLGLPLDLDALSEFLRQKVDAAKWERLGRRAGLDAVVPGAAHDDEINLARLLLTAQTAGLESIAQLAKLLGSIAEEEAHGILAKVGEEVRAWGGSLEAVPVDVLTILVSYKKRRDLPPGFNWGGHLKPSILNAMRKTLLQPSGDA